METLLRISLVLVLQYLANTAGFLDEICPCADKTFCGLPPPRNKSIGSLQTTIYIDQDTEWGSLPWQQIDVIVTTDGFHSNQLMCHGHSKGTQYGTLVSFLDFSRMAEGAGGEEGGDEGSEEGGEKGGDEGGEDGVSEEGLGAKRWLDSYASRLADQHRDVIMLDLDLIFHVTPVEDPEARIEFLQDISESLRKHIPTVQVGVVHHKNEECSSENRLCHYLQRVMGIADFIVLSAQSDHLKPSEDGHCVARSTSPYINYVSGLEEFNLCSIPLEKTMLQIPFQATDFTCSEMNSQTGSCQLRSCSHFQSRKLQQVTEIQIQYKAEAAWSNSHKSSYFNYWNISDGKLYQMWYEDERGATFKVNLAKTMGLKGLVLPHSSITGSLSSDFVQSLLEDSNSKINEDSSSLQRAFTSGIAGVCAALFAFGVLMGIVLSYTIFYVHRNGRKTTWVRAPSSEEDITVISRDYR